MLSALTLLGASRSLDGLVLDGFFQLRGPQPDAGDIVIVALGEDFLEAYETTLGRLDRRFYAGLSKPCSRPERQPSASTSSSPTPPPRTQS